VTKPIKLIIWDLDDTFWSGTLSEGGVVFNKENQEIIVELTRRGIINSICSKNDFESAKSFLCEKGIWEYFVFPNINWKPKGQAIAQIISDMQLRAENVLFIDDNPLNLGEAQFYATGLQVASPDIIGQLLDLEALKGNADPNFSRLLNYKTLEQKRESKKAFSGSNEDFLRSCKIEVTFIEDCVKHSERILDLINRSNQLNFTKKRIVKNELNSLLADISIDSKCLSVADQYGDYGICGFYAIQDMRLLHFVFSCRVLDMGIERWLFHRLGNPEILIAGEVASSLVDASIPDWINVTPYSEVNENLRKEASDRITIVIKGGCDLEQLFVYMRDSCLIETEFNYVSAEGFPIHTEHTEILRQCVPQTIELYGNIIDKLPFLDRSAFNTNFFSNNFDAYIYSVLMDMTQGLYRYQDTDFIVPFGDFLVDITQEVNWSRYIDKYYDKGMTQDFFKWFAKNFHFEGVLSQSRFAVNLNWMRNRLGEDKLVVILNASEVKLVHETEIDRWEHYKGYNRILDDFQKDKRRAVICDVRKIVTGESDVTDNIRHYSRHKYFEIAGELVQILNRFNYDNDLWKKKMLSFPVESSPNLHFLKHCLRTLYQVAAKIYGKLLQ
jgi:FkbH-like protein